jgi:hypothetical protein
MKQLREPGRSVRLASLVAAIFALFALPGHDGRAGAPPDTEPTGRGWIENRGQIDAAVRYYTVGDRGAVYFTSRGPVLEIRAHASAPGEISEPLPDHPTRRRERRTLSRARRLATAIRFVDANPSIEITGEGELSVRRHFLTGGNSESWRIDVPAYERIVYHEVWRGVDLVYRIADEGLVYEVVAGPGADLDAVSFGYEGAEAVRATAGVHRLDTPLGSIEDRQPVGGARLGSIRFTDDTAASAKAMPVRAAAGPAGFPSSALEARDVELGMRLWWSTFLGGARDDAVYAIAMEDGAHPVVTGATLSADFPTTLGVVDPDYASSFDVFVTKFDYDGSTILWSTYLGGSNDDRGWAIAIDGSARPVVAGITSSPDYPVTPGAYDTSYNDGYDAIVSKLSADGTALVWSSYFGGGDREWDVSGLALDGAGRPVFVGSTRSTDLPTSPGAYDVSLDGTQDAFVAALSADGGSLAFSTYLGGADSDAGEDVALDSAGLPVAVGGTSSADFPATPGALQATSGGARDGFVTKLAADGGALVFSTFLGGAGADDGFGVVLAGSDRLLVTGGTTSSDFPTTPGAYGVSYSGAGDAFVTRLAADGTAQIWGTYFGGSGEEKGLEIVEDGAERPIFVGWTCSSDFPLAGPPLDDEYYTCDGFLTRLSPDGTVPLYSSYVGGWRDDSVFALALGEQDRLLAGGETFSSNFPTTPNAFDRSHNSPDDFYDAFVLEVLTPVYCTSVTGATDPLLRIGKAVEGNCPEGTPEGQLIDLVEGYLESLDPVDVGEVWRIACDSPEVVFGNDLTPPVGFGLFQMARFGPDGVYSDGAGPGLVGDRTIVGGDCP